MIVQVAEAALPFQHCLKGTKYLFHLRLFVRKDIRRIHAMDDHVGAKLEQQQSTVTGLTAIER